ncbi:MAG TPA: hypothetical protein VD998_01195 [Verrucomicrobiae bacterium]|nr:hypothetical protein [Verrucomicrobiae bacterium]
MPDINQNQNFTKNTDPDFLHRHMKILLLVSGILIAAGLINIYGIEQRRKRIDTNIPAHKKEHSESNWPLYINKEYGFEIKFTDKWKNYKVVKGKNTKVSDQLVNVVYSFGLPDPENKSGYAQDGFAYPLEIIIEPKSEWDKELQYVDAIDRKVMEAWVLSKNDSYVFFFLHWGQDPPPGYGPEELDIDQILSTFKLTTHSSDSKVFVNEKYGFEFQHPESTVVTKNEPSGRFGTGVNFSVSEPDSKWIYSVDVKPNNAGLTTEQVFTENYDFYKNLATQYTEFRADDLYVSDIKVSDIDAKMLYIDNFGDVGSTMVSVTYNGYVYMIAGGIHKGELDSFLKTFKFIIKSS